MFTLTCGPWRMGGDSRWALDLRLELLKRPRARSAGSALQRAPSSWSHTPLVHGPSHCFTGAWCARQFCCAQHLRAAAHNSPRKCRGRVSARFVHGIELGAHCAAAFDWLARVLCFYSTIFNLAAFFCFYARALTCLFLHDTARHTRRAGLVPRRLLASVRLPVSRVPQANRRVRWRKARASTTRPPTL